MIRIGLVLMVGVFFMAIQDDSQDKLLEQYKKGVSTIVSKLSDPDTWKNAIYEKDKAKTEVLLKYLELASALRCEKVEEILIKHITYTPFEDKEVGLLPPRKEYPVYGALCRIGLRAVDPLVKLLKTTDPDRPNDIDKIAQRTHTLAIYCLVDIYDQGGEGEKLANDYYTFKPKGIGKKMARQRLLLELEGTTGKEKELLEKALKHPWLKLDEK